MNSIGTITFVLKTKYDTDKTEVKKKVSDTSGLVKKTDYNTKITEIEGKIPDISSLATKTALTAVENKIPSVSSLVKKSKTDYDTKITETEKKLTDHNHDKYITTPEFNTIAASVFNARLAQANLVSKTYFDNKVSSLDSKIAVNKTKNESIENELKKLKKFDSSYFIGKSHFEEDGTQIYLVFQLLNKYFKVIVNTDYASPWESKGLSAETIKPPATSDNGLTPVLSYYGTKTRVKFTGSCLKQTTISYNHRPIINIYIVYELGASSSHFNDLTLKNCLFGAVTLTKDADVNKYHYSGYGIGFDRKGRFSFPSSGFSQNGTILGTDMSSSVHVDNKERDVLILGSGPTQGVGEHSLTSEKMYSITFAVTKKKFCLSLHYNGANNYLFVNSTEIYKFKSKDSEIVAAPLCLGNNSKDWSVDHVKKTGFNSYVYDFSVDYGAIAVDDILDIHKYLMKKNNIV